MTCKWCGEELVGKRRHAEYCDSSCRGEATRWRQSRSGDDQKALQSAATPPIAAIRAEQEAAKDHWSQIVREGIIDHLRHNTGEPFHADDLEPLGIPDEHRNIIGSQIARLVNQKWMVECGRRKSIIPSRNGAKSNEYRLTELGRDRIVGVEGETSGGCLGSPVSGGSLHSGEGSSEIAASAPPASGEPARLFDGAPPSAYDPYSEAA